MSLLASVRHLYDSQPVCKFILILNAVLWGYSFLVMKDVVAKIPVGWLLALRFIPAALLVFLLTYKKILSHLDKRTIIFGLGLGFLGWAGYITQTIGLTFTTPGKNAFLTGVYSVLVPFCAWAIGLGKPERYNVVGAIVALVGLGFVALDNGFPLNIGDALTLVGAFFFALQMAEVSKRGPGMDVAAITFWEFIALGFASLIWGVISEPIPEFASFTWSDWGVLAFLSVVCSCFTIITTNHAFIHVDPTAGALLSSLESPLGVIFSVLLGYELLTGRLILGFALILAGVLFSEGGPWIIAHLDSFRNKRQTEREATAESR